MAPTVSNTSTYNPAQFFVSSGNPPPATTAPDETAINFASIDLNALSQRRAMAPPNPPVSFETLDLSPLVHQAGWINSIDSQFQNNGPLTPGSQSIATDSVSKLLAQFTAIG